MTAPVAMGVQLTWPTMAQLGATFANLPGMMARMHDVELEPLVDGQRSEDRVIEHLDGAVRLARARGSFVKSGEITTHGVQDRGQIERACWNDVFRRLAALRKITEIDHHELPRGLGEGHRAGERPSLFEASFKAFRGAGVRTGQVLDDLNDRPSRGVATPSAFLAAAGRGVDNNREAVLEMRIHWG